MINPIQCKGCRFPYYVGYDSEWLTVFAYCNKCNKKIELAFETGDQECEVMWDQKKQDFWFSFLNKPIDKKNKPDKK